MAPNQSKLDDSSTTPSRWARPRPSSGIHGFRPDAAPSPKAPSRLVNSVISTAGVCPGAEPPRRQDVARYRQAASYA